MTSKDDLERQEHNSCFSWEDLGHTEVILWCLHEIIGGLAHWVTTYVGPKETAVRFYLFIYLFIYYLFWFTYLLINFIY